VTLLVLLLLILLGWAVVGFLTAMPGPRHVGRIANLTEEERLCARRLRAHVETLAARPRDSAAAQACAIEYIEERLRACGLEPLRQHTRSQGAPPRSAGRALQGLPNIEVEIRGTMAGSPIVIVGAHYDTVDRSPGADDNASGVAVLLELAARLGGERLARTVRLVAFAEEERDLMGSRFYASNLRARGVGVAAMVSLEMLGYYDDAEGTQRYPIGALGALYPSRGDFVAVVSNIRSRALLRTFVGTFRRAVAMPCEGMAAPELLRDIGRSDNASFWLENYPAVMLTDTSNFRNPHYHRESDTPETLDYLRMARVANGVEAVVRRLASLE
jgi:hypothetical protein